MALRTPRPLLASLSTLAALGCGGEDLVLPSPREPAQLEVIQGDEQFGSPGLPLPNPVVVRLVDEAGNGIPERGVTWVVSTGGGSVTPVNGTTDREGRASAQWTLGPEVGSNTLTAVVAGLGGRTIRATAITGAGGAPSAGRSTVTAAPTSIPAETGLSTITVTVRDDDGEPVPGAVVSLAATGSGNTILQPSGTTGLDGVATGSVSSTTPETKVISATVNGSVLLSRTAQVVVTPGATLSIELLEGNGQIAPAGSPVPVRPAVRVTDGSGQPVAGVGVAFVVTGGGGSVEGGTQVTGSDGIARVGNWTLGSSPGINTLEARAGSLPGSPVIFTAEGTPGGSPARFVFQVQPRDVEEDETFSVVVAVVDEDGNVVPLSGVTIYIGLFREGDDTPTNTRLSGERARTTVNGVAVFSNLRVTKSDDDYRLRAVADELPALAPTFSQAFDVD